MRAPIAADITDIMCGSYTEKVELTENASSFVPHMLARLENIQKMDFMERDRAFMKRKILATRVTSEETEKRIQLLSAQKETVLIRKALLEEESSTNEQLAILEEKIAAENAELAKAESERKARQTQLQYLEEYWAELEADHGCREEAIQWMKGLPTGRDGAVEFLNGMTDAYAKAFFLSITVHDPLNCTVHWFDDTKTEVEMESSVYNNEFK